jgi:imidazolonepropionase
MESGATTIEVKSGYGLSIEQELRMLEAISMVRRKTPARIVPTLLLHVPPKDAGERAAYVAAVCGDLIPAAAMCGLAAAVDVFVEREAWDAEDAERMLRAALEAGLQVKLHTEQFHRVGGLELGVQLGAVSVDHLEAMDGAQILTLAEASTVATILPGVSLHLGIPSAPGRALIDAGAAVALGTDLNPGSSPMPSLAATMALSIRMNGLTAHEALSAGTVNAAAALGLSDAGRIAPGHPADFCVLHGRDWRELMYWMGVNPVKETWIAGRRVLEGRM